MSAPKLKDFFDADLIRELATELRAVDPRFDAEGFITRCIDGLARLELTARAWHVAEAMRVFLPERFTEAATLLVASLRPELPGTGEFGLAPLRYMPHVYFVQKYGLEDFEASMYAQFELTKRFSAEMSIRAFLERHPEATYARLLEWTSNENVHVRRLVSEGTRPRLPWAPRLRAYQADPRPVVALLERLKDDPERYVQRSVANNLNDIGKDHPDLVVEICRHWLDGASSGRAWIVRHALRSLVKKGHRGALALNGADAEPQVAIEGIRFDPPEVTLGGELRFSFELISTTDRPQPLLVDYTVHFVKANGSTRPKVFKLRKLDLPPSGRATFAGSVSFKDLSTRRHYPGRHFLDVLVNGVAQRLGEFSVHAPAQGVR